MKKLIALMGSVCLCGSAFAQGTVTFANGGTTLIQNEPSGPSSIVSAPVGGATLQLYYLPATANPTALSIVGGAFVNTSGWELLGATAGIAPLAGRFNGGTRTTGSDVAGGASVWLEVVGWTGTSSSITAALAANADVGISGDWKQATGNPSSVPPGNPVGFPLNSTGFNGLVLTPVPEPATLALGGLGAAAMFFLRRKK